MRRSKGVTDVMISLIVDLIVIGLIVFYYVATQSKYFEISTIVTEAGVERHVLNVGQVLMSYGKLVYVEDEPQSGYTRINRGVLVKEKIAEQFKDGSDLTKEIGYPNSLIVLYVKDLDTNEAWKLSYNGPFDIKTEFDFSSCMISKTRLDFSSLFSGGPWGPFDIASCLSSEISKYGSGVWYSPVAIKDGSSVHAGILKVGIYEWWPRL